MKEKERQNTTKKNIKAHTKVVIEKKSKVKKKNIRKELKEEDLLTPRRGVL